MYIKVCIALPLVEMIFIFNLVAYWRIEDVACLINYIDRGQKTCEFKNHSKFPNLNHRSTYTCRYFLLWKIAEVNALRFFLGIQTCELQNFWKCLWNWKIVETLFWPLQYALTFSPVFVWSWHNHRSLHMNYSPV